MNSISAARGFKHRAELKFQFHALSISLLDSYKLRSACVRISNRYDYIIRRARREPVITLHSRLPVNRIIVKSTYIRYRVANIRVDANIKLSFLFFFFLFSASRLDEQEYGVCTSMRDTVKHLLFH